MARISTEQDLSPADGPRVSTLLNTLAMFKANYERERGYLANFEPFVADVLRDWSHPGDPGEPITPAAIRDRLEERFSIPSMPINTAEMLIHRAVRREWVHRSSNGLLFRDQNALGLVPGVRPGAESMLEHVEELIRGLCEYARRAHDLEWSRTQASDALERFVEEFSFELARAKRVGADDLAGSSVPADMALTVVNGFVRQAFTSEDERTTDHLMEMVQGSMLANVLYFRGLGNWSESLKSLTVYLDTTVALRLLKLSPDPLTQATAEMMELLRGLDVNVRIFEHTIDEMHGVLVSVADSLRRSQAGVVDPQASARTNREVSDAAVQNGWDPSDIDEVASDLHRRLIAAGAQPEQTPETPARVDVNAPDLRTILADGIGYNWDNPLDKDVMSAIATHVLRRGHECRKLSRTPALFVTANPKLAQLTQGFFREDGVTGAIPHVITDVSFTTQLWVRLPEVGWDIPRSLLIAESYAALSEGPELWGRYLHAIERQRERGAIDDQQVKALVYEMESREPFLQLTHGEPDSVDEGTPLRVLDRLRNEVEERANVKVKEVTAEATMAAAQRDVLMQEVEKNTDQIRAQEAQLATQEETISDLQDWKEVKEVSDRRLRQGAGTAGAAVAAIAAVALPVGGLISGALALAGVLTCLLALSVVSVAWGFRRSAGWAFAAFLGVGAALAIPVGIYTLASANGSEGPSKQPPAGVPRR